MPDIVIIIRYILEFLDTIYKEYKQNERKKQIDKIKKSPNTAWNDKFSNRDDRVRDSSSDQ